MDNQAVENTDRELYRDDTGSIHVTKQGNIGVECGGLVVVMSVRRWHEAGKEYAFSRVTEVSKASELRQEDKRALTCELGSRKKWLEGDWDSRRPTKDFDKPKSTT